MLKKWMHTPMSQTPKYPTARSAREVLPDFNGNPPWNEARGKELIDRHTRVVVGEAKPPSFKEFVTASHRPLGKGAAAEGPPTGTWQLLPYKVLWVLYLGVLWAWKEGTTPAKWVAPKVTLIYKKGLVTEAANYCPIFVNPMMYVVFMKVVYWRYAPLIMDSLDVYQYAVRGRTTLMQCLNLVHAVTAPKSRWKDGCICKLDIVKAFPSVPHVLLYHMMRRMGWSTSLLRAFQESMQRTTCSCRVGTEEVRWTPKRGLQEGCPMLPILFTAYYNVYIQELKRRHPDVLFLSNVEDILFVAADLEEVRAVWRSMDEIGGILGLRAHPGKTELYHWGGQSVGRKVLWQDLPIEVRAPYLEYLGHYMAAPQCRGIAKEDFRQHAMAELTRYRSLPLDDWEKVQLLNVVIAPRVMHKAVLLRDEEYWYYIDKVFQDYVWESHGQVKGQMRAKMNKTVKKGGMGLCMPYRTWRARFITVMHGSLRRPSPIETGMLRSGQLSTPPQQYADMVHELGGKTVFQVSVTRQVKGGDQLLEDETTDDEVVTTTQVRLKEEL